MCACVCVLVLCECSGGHFSVANGYTITGHGHYRGYSRAMWPHIITIDAQFAVWLCVGAVVIAVHPQSLLQARSTVGVYLVNNETANIRRSNKSRNVILKLKLKVEHGGNTTLDAADW